MNKEIEKKAVACILKYKMHDVSGLSEILEFEQGCKGISQTELLESDMIAKALTYVRTRLRAELLGSWAEPSAAPALQMAFFKLMASEKDFSRLTSQRIEVENKEESAKIDLSKLSNSELVRLEELTKKAQKDT